MRSPAVSNSTKSTGFPSTTAFVVYYERHQKSQENMQIFHTLSNTVGIYSLGKLYHEKNSELEANIEGKYQLVV
jgi:hypothetical protein